MKQIKGIGDSEFNREGYLALLGMMYAMAQTLKLNKHVDIIYESQDLDGYTKCTSIKLEDIMELTDVMYEMSPAHNFEDELEE